MDIPLSVYANYSAYREGIQEANNRHKKPRKGLEVGYSECDLDYYFAFILSTLKF
jgi:hypothetical protein